MSLSLAELPTSYEYYTGNGITSGLSDNQPYFTLNEKNITIYSGAFHYFRTARAYWRDRLRKMRAAGLNTVETYVPWNLHEPQSGRYDFGEGGTDMEDFLHIDEFLRIAQEEDLFALVRPGPFICAEFEFGGLPSWLLRNTTIIRSSKDNNYMSYVKRYFNMLLPILAFFQFQNGGPIIGFQIENEYGSTWESDQSYLQVLKDLFLDNGITELLYTADGPDKLSLGTLPGILATVNIESGIFENLMRLNHFQANKPTMVMESYPGWFDHWGESHFSGMTDLEYLILLTEILAFPSSVNIYMFTGGTSFGFLNGANTKTNGTNNSGLQFDTTSYDYSAPISEQGIYTSKYDIIKQVFNKSAPIKTKIPEQPELKPTVAYPALEVAGQILLSDVIDSYKDYISSENIIPMEMLPINNNSGQSYGYVVYRKSNIDLQSGAVLKISGYVRDTVLVLLNGKLISKVPKNFKDLDGFGFWRLENSTITLTETDITAATLDLVVENCGRNNYGRLNQFKQFKGLTENVYVNDNVITNWNIIPLEFKTEWNLNLNKWNTVGNVKSTPALYKFNLNIKDEPQDTFINMKGWTKGITILNGFVLGRHFFVGPQLTLYLPAPLLQQGNNEIIVFEHYDAVSLLQFSNVPIYENPKLYT